ncbi:MAG TPA: ABC transporter permease [Candidatus Deferrimicrobiaceae bacterium]
MTDGTLPRLLKHRGAAAGLAFLALLSLAAVLAPRLAAFDPAAQSLGAGLSRASAVHWLGQDRLGRDILSRLLYGSRISLAVGLGTVALSIVPGLFIGAISGFAGGKVDALFMRLCDLLLAFPGLLLAIAITAVLGPSPWHVILALSILGWVGYARLIRGQVRKVRESEFVQAARSVGVSPGRQLVRHVLPNALSPLIVEATFGIGRAVVSEAGLSFLGLGVSPPTPSWGAMIAEGRHFLFIAPHLTLAPGLAIMLTVMAFNFVGDGLRDAMDVRDPGVEGTATSARDGR